MPLREAILVALDTLWAHKLRSFLTLLGVVVSIWTLVAVVALVQGVNGYVAQKIAGLGSNVVSVQRFSLKEMTDQSLFREARKRNTPIELAEYQYLREHMPGYRTAAQVGRTNGTSVKSGRHLMQDVNVQGVTADILPMTPYKVAAGRFLTENDERHRTPVVFIGNDVAEQIFPGINPLGQDLNVDGTVFRVIGVASVQGSVFGQSQDNFLQIPLGLYRAQYGTADSLEVLIQASSPLALAAATDRARMLLRSYRHISYQNSDNFGLIGADSLMTLFHRLTGAIAAVMVGVGIIFLVVGGIVIMNIMMAAVTERTREVGIRKALGARRRDILLQFLVESAVLSTAGGLLGIGLAYGFTLLAGALTPLPFSLPWLAVLAALAVSTATGIFFGLYPASKAAKLQPIAALRSEA